MNKIEEIFKNYQTAKSIKTSWNEKYEETCRYIMPSKYDIGNKEYVEKHSQILASIGESSANSFVNRMQQIITPINSDFIGLEFPDYIEGKEEKNKELEKLCKLINSYKNASNFDVTITEFYYELILGTACLLVQGNSFNKPLVFKTIPFKEYCIHEGEDGTVDAVYREIEIEEKQIKYTWTDSNYKESGEEKKKLKLLETTIFNYENNLYDYYVFINETKEIIVKREYKTNPFIILRWNKFTGDYYGRGVGIMALPDVKTLNKILDYSLRSLAFNIPILLAKEDESFDVSNFKLKPGAINKVPSNETGNPSISPLKMDINNDITQYNIANIEMKIKRIMLDNTIPDDSKVRTATEVASRIQELNVNLTSMFGRLLNEFLYPLVKRIIEVLQIYGYVNNEFELKNINGYKIKIKIKTALALQDKQEELQKTVQAIQIITSFDPTGQTIQTYFNTEKLIPYLLRLSGINEDLISTDKEIKEKQLQQQQTIRSQQEQAIQDQVDLSNAIERGKENVKNGF